jgi:hypothetical protein
LLAAAASASTQTYAFLDNPFAGYAPLLTARTTPQALLGVVFANASVLISLLLICRASGLGTPVTKGRTQAHPKS